MKITDSIHQLTHNFNIRLADNLTVSRFVNSFIVFNNDEVTLIDSGTKNSFNKISNYLSSNGSSIESVKNLVLSHAHPDHIGSAAAIKSISNCTVFAHSLEKEWIEDIDLQIKNRSVPNFKDLADSSVIIDKELKGGETLELGSTTLKIHNSPGHSPGSINIYFKEDNILFTGDNIPLYGDIPNYHSYKELLESLNSIRHKFNPDILLSSWHKPVKNKSEQKDLIESGFNYLKLINSWVLKHYLEEDDNNLMNCEKVINSLKLPKFMVNPIVDRSFGSHL